jgi:pSer/pThr/pTyr-binding forkhead associated (FHA) protein
MNEKPVLVAREGQLAGQRWTIESDEFLIGRGSDCQIILPERQVSRHHVRITHENGRYTLRTTSNARPTARCAEDLSARRT